MTTDRILKYLMSDVDRAKDTGQRDVTVSVDDLRYALGIASSSVHRDEQRKAITHAGWVDPAQLADLRGGRINGLVVRKKKGQRANTEVYFCDNLAEKRAEADAAEQREEVTA